MSPSSVKAARHYLLRQPRHEDHVGYMLPVKLKPAIEYRHLLLRTRPRRYAELFRTIYTRRCRSLVEIGTWNGVHAEQMIRGSGQRVWARS